MSGLVPPATLEQIRAANDIVDVIGTAIPLKRNGANFVALCPFHREKTPSFNVSPTRQSFHCFGCHKGGDVFTWIREYENLSFMEAVKRLAQRAGITLEYEQAPGYQQSRAVKDSLLAIHEDVAHRWQRCLANEAGAGPAREYLESRAVPSEAIELFRLGYAPDLWDDTVNWARSRGHDHALIEQAGLIIKREGGEGYYDRFRGRLIFPICDEQGRVIAFSGRVLDPGAKTAKYVNSPETPIFTKGRVFFGLDKSKRSLLDEQRAIVCEGQLDMMRCFINGVRNVVAPQGTALTSDHARLLKRYVEEVILCFDSDEAGRNASERSFESLAEAGVAVRVATLPAPHDPDSFIREFGADAFRKLADSAPGYFDFLLDRACTENDPTTDRGRVAVVHTMSTALARTGNQVLNETYVRKTALRLGVSSEAVQAEMRKRQRLRSREAEIASAPESTGGEDSRAARPDPLELSLLRLVLCYDELLDWFGHHLDAAWLANPWTKELVQLRLSIPETAPKAFISHVASEPARQLASELLTEDRQLSDPVRVAVDTVTRLRNRRYLLERSELERAASARALTREEQERLRFLFSAPKQPLMPLPEA